MRELKSPVKNVVFAVLFLKMCPMCCTTVHLWTLKYTNILHILSLDSSLGRRSETTFNTPSPPSRTESYVCGTVTSTLMPCRTGKGRRTLTLLGSRKKKSEPSKTYREKLEPLISNNKQANARAYGTTEVTEKCRGLVISNKLGYIIFS